MKIAAGCLRSGSMVSSGRPRRTLTPPFAEAVPPPPEPAPTIRTSISYEAYLVSTLTVEPPPPPPPEPPPVTPLPPEPVGVEEGSPAVLPPGTTADGDVGAATPAAAAAPASAAAAPAYCCLKGSLAVRL